MSAEEMAAAVDMVSANPSAGDLIVGSGGCRKLRLAGRGHGKSGGYRIMTYNAGARGYVYLFAVLSKGSAANFTPAQIAAISELAKTIRSEG